MQEEPTRPTLAFDAAAAAGCPLRHWLTVVATGAAIAASAAAEVTLTASSPAGNTVIQPGGTFDVVLTWSGPPVIAAADYAVTLNTTQLELIGRDFDASLSPYADTPYLAALPATIPRLDATWFKATGFTGRDLTLHFRVPASYTGPTTLAVGLVVDGVQDRNAASIPVITAGTTVSLQPRDPLTATNATTVAQTARWSALTWTGATPNGPGDGANFSFTDTQTITLDVPVTLGRLSCVGTGSFGLLRSGSNTLTLDNTRLGTVASLLFSSPGPPNVPDCRLDADLVLNSDLIGTWARMDGGALAIHGLLGLIGGTGRLALNYAIAPTEGPDTGAAILLNGIGHLIHLGLAGEAPNTYLGGTDLRAGSSDFGTVKFITNKVNALGATGTAGRLSMHQAALDLSTCDQTVGGLTGGTGNAKISSASTIAGTTTLTLDCGSDKGPFSFSGVIMDGAATGVNGAIRALSLTKTGTGLQALTNHQTYTGATTITAGTLLINGSLAGGSAVTVASGGTLGGTGTVNGPSTIHGTLAPGAAVGTMTLGTVTLAGNSRLAIEIADWKGATPGVSWDLLNCTSLALGGTLVEPPVIRPQTLNLANFTETAKIFTIATAATAITGFHQGATMIDPGTLPGTGSWTTQLDATGRNLQLVYTPGGIPSAAYETWAAANGLTAATRAPSMDPDHDGATNLAEFAFHGDPRDGANRIIAVTERKDSALDPDADPELVLTCAVRRGAVFAADANGAQVSAAIDGLVYTVEASADLAIPWASPVISAGISDTPPTGSGLPDLTGTDWEYRTFSAFNGLPNDGILRAGVDLAF